MKGEIVGITIIFSINTFNDEPFNSKSVAMAKLNLSFKETAFFLLFKLTYVKSSQSYAVRAKVSFAVGYLPFKRQMWSN